MTTPSQAEQLRQAQAGIRALVERDLRAYLSTLDLSNVQIVRSRLLRFVPDLVESYGESAAAMAQDWYEGVRESYNLPRHFRAVAPSAEFWDETRDAVDGTIRRVAGLAEDGSTATLTTALSSKVGKYTIGASREAIRRSTFTDPMASGWRRATRAGACDFCRMLAGRGAVYRDDTVRFAAHGSCNCAAVPSWDQNAPEVDVDLYRASERTTGMTDEQRAQHNALIHRAIEQYVDDEPSTT